MYGGRRLNDHIVRSEGYAGHLDPYQLFEEMEDKDAHLFSLLQTRKLGVLARARTLKAADDTPAALAARSRRHNGVALTTRTPDKVRKVLASLPDVPEVSSEVDGRLIIGAKDGASIITQVSTALREADAEVQQITVEHGRLDEVFREITTRQSAHA